MTDNPAFTEIKTRVNADDIVLFMKGNPSFPQCGFSSVVVEILKHMEMPFQSYDVLAEPDIRQGIKDYSEWPTVPQLYVKGEFVGGCDIIKEMFTEGELQALFDEKGVKKTA